MINKRARNYKKIITTAGLFLAILAGCFLGFSNNTQAAGMKFSTVSDISKQLENVGMTMSAYIEGIYSKGYWRYGPTYDASGDRTVTLAEEYCFDRLTEKPAKYYDDDNRGDILFTSNTKYTVDLNTPTGFHLYDYEIPEGTQIPLAGWENHGRVYATHYELFDVMANPVGNDGGLIDPTTYGRWARYHGIEFHSIAEIAMTAPGEVRTSCYNHKMKGFNRNSTTWMPICAVCGRDASSGNIYACYEAVMELPILEQGQEYVVTCPTCGGMENAGVFSHKCKAVSANRYFIHYDDGTDDPDVTGFTPSSVWYHNKATEYEGKPIETQHTLIAECKYERPGYHFVGWSLTPNGIVDFQPGNTILKAQSYLPNYDNNAFVKVYAVWEPNLSYLKVDANSNVYGGGSTYNGQSIWTSEATPYQIQDVRDVSDKGSFHSYAKSTHVLDTSKIENPDGYTVTFNASGNPIKDATGQIITKITATTNFEGYDFITTEKNGSFVANTGTYTFGPNEGTEDNADVIKLQFSQNQIKLPTATKSNACFIGWYEDSSYTKFVGTEGDGYLPTKNITLYARFSTVDFEVTDVYYKQNSGANSFTNVARNKYGYVINNYATPDASYFAIQNAKGATNLRASLLTPYTWTTAYEFLCKRTTDPTSAYKVITDANGVNGASTSAYGKTFNTAGKDQTFVIQSTGYYQIDAYGAQGGNHTASGKTGGAGGRTYGTFYFKKGDTVKVQVGGQGDTATGGGKSTSTTTGGIGGGYSKVSKISNGTETVLLIAGGGGGANASFYGGEGGTALVPTYSEQSGKESQYGGGGGGATGGNGGGTSYKTTFDNPDIADVAFRGPATKKYGAWQIDKGDVYRTQNAVIQDVGLYDVIVQGHGMYDEDDEYIGFAHTTNTTSFPTVIVYHSVSPPIFWDSNNTIGGLNRTITFEYRHPTDDEEYSYNDHKVSLATPSEAPRWTCYQSDDGFARTAIATYPTNGNTNLVVSAGISAWGGGADYYIRFIVYNADTNELIHDVTKAAGSDGDWSTEAQAYADLNVSGASNVRVEIEVMFDGGGNHTGAHYGDTWFYGKTVGTAAQAAGGSNYINTSLAVKNSTQSLQGQKTGAGYVSVTPIKIGLQDATTNLIEILGADTPDWGIPGTPTLDVLPNKNGVTISWDKVDSNTSLVGYDYMVNVYRIDPTLTNGYTKVLTSDILTRNMESQIAGYYYVYNDSSTFNIANYIQQKISANTFTKPVYTWSNSYLSDATLKFTQSTSLTTNTSSKYVHIAAVDVAGNVGATTSKELAKKNLCRITFNTNHLEMQLNPAYTVDNGPWDVPGKTTELSAPDKNKQDYYYRGFYAIEGTDISNNGKGTFDGVSLDNFGGQFPTPSATGCVFIGWNAKPDGSGIYYSADGSNIGYNGITDQVLVLSDITENHNYGQEITLYAIWADVAENTSLTNTQAGVIQKTYNKPELNTTTGTFISNGNPLVRMNEITTSDANDAIWTNKVNVLSNAQFSATGVYAMDHHLFTQAGMRVATVDYYMAGAAENSTSYYELRKIVAEEGGINNPIWIKENDNKVIVVTHNGSTSFKPDTFYNAGEKKLDVRYHIQGSYRIYGSAISRSYASGDLINIGQQGYPGYVTTKELTLKVDSTIPMINHYKVKQDSLDNYTVEQLPSVIGKPFLTQIEVSASDYNNSNNGIYYSQSDSSGIQGVYMSVCDVMHMDEAKVYKMSLNTNETIKKTDYDNHVLEAKYKLSVNFYTEFPEADTLLYRIYAVDNAGNISQSLDDVKVVKPDGTITEDLPIGDVETDLDEPYEGMGLLQNFSVKTVIYSDEDDAFNVAEGETYFQVGDFGHVEVWTIGYTDSVQLNFGGMGEEAKDEIINNKLQKIYHMGLLEDGWTRTISWDKSDMMIPESFTVYDDILGKYIEITQESHPDEFNDLLINDAGVYYAQHYSLQGWNDDGMSIRIPPYYKLTIDEGNVNEDGTPQYKWELWLYAVQANKNSGTDTTTSSYILWDTRANDIHYRVTHES